MLLVFLRVSEMDRFVSNIFERYNADLRMAEIVTVGRLSIYQTPESDQVCIQSGTEGTVLLPTALWNQIATPALRAPTYEEWKKFWARPAEKKRKA